MREITAVQIPCEPSCDPALGSHLKATTIYVFAFRNFGLWFNKQWIESLFKTFNRIDHWQLLYKFSPTFSTEPVHDMGLNSFSQQCQVNHIKVRFAQSTKLGYQTSQQDPACDAQKTRAPVGQWPGSSRIPWTSVQWKAWQCKEVGTSSCNNQDCNLISRCLQ